MKKNFTLILVALFAMVGMKAQAAMYLVGDAFNGWNTSGNVVMSTDDNNIYYYTADLTAGKYFAFFKDNEGWSYQRGPAAGNNSAPSGDWENTTSGGSWRVATSGTYLIQYNHDTDQAKIAIAQQAQFDPAQRKFAVTGAAFGGWNMPPTAAQTFTNNGDGTYTLVYEGATAGQFKLSGVGINDEFDSGWGVFNGGCLYNGSLAIGDNALSAGNTGNMNFPVGGNVTLTISNVTESSCSLNITVNEEVIPDKAYYLIGAVNGWNDETKIPFVENDGVFTLTQTFSGEFKIKDENGNWLGGGVTLTAENPSVTLVEGENLVLTEEREYTLTIEDGVLTVTGFPEPVVLDEAYYLIGDVNGWNDETKIPFVENDGVFTLTQTFSGEFKIKDENGNWLGGGVTLTAENPSVTLVEGENLVLTDESEYTLTIEDGVLTVTGFPAPPALTGVELRGSYDENWTEVITYVMQNVDGAWVLNNQEIDPGFEFKVVATYDNGSQEWYGAQADGDYWVTLAALGNAIGMGTTGGYNNLFFDDAGTFTFTVNGDLTSLIVTGEFDPEVFTGIVYDVLDRPIANVQVTAMPLVASVDGIMLRDEATGYTTTTPADGSFRLEVPGGVNYEVSFEKYGYLPQTLNENEVGDVVLEWDAATAITDLTAGEKAVSVKYVSTTGMMSDTPFKGVNIMVVTYQDGSRKAVKIVK